MPFRRVAAAVLCLAFALAFGLVGAAGTWGAGSALWEGYRSSDWVRVRAQVEAFDGSTARYRYTVDGHEHVGTRIVFSPMQEMGWIPDATADRLEASLRERKPLLASFDPDDASQAVVERDVPWAEAILVAPFALLFLLMGLGALRAFLRTSTGQRPWLDAGAANAGMGVGGLWAFALVWNAMAFPASVLFVPQMLEEQEWLGLLVLLFPLVGLGVLYAAFRVTVERLYGPSTPPSKPRQRAPAAPGAVA